MKKMLIGLAVLALALVGCGYTASDAYVASHNLSQDADMFRIYRRVVFYNGITDEYILQVEGFCSIDVDGYDNQLELTVKTDDGQFLKHFLGLSDNVTYFVEQLDPATVSDSSYKVIFKPSVIIPNIELH
jgi:hypothetical protein